MKTFKTILSAIIMGLILLIAAPTATAQQLSEADKKLAATELNKKLPMEISDGFSLTKVIYYTDSRLVEITFKIEPSKMGMTLSNVKEYFNGLTNAELKEIISEDLFELMSVFDNNVQIIIAFPDNTSKKFLFRK